MATYREKVQKYRAKIIAQQELGLEPKGIDVAKLRYYVGRAQKKGPDHKTKPKDKINETLLRLERVNLAELIGLANMLG